jgi:hypothetical protein
MDWVCLRALELVWLPLLKPHNSVLFTWCWCEIQGPSNASAYSIPVSFFLPVATKTCHCKEESGSLAPIPYRNWFRLYSSWDSGLYNSPKLWRLDRARLNGPLISCYFQSALHGNRPPKAVLFSVQGGVSLTNKKPADETTNQYQSFYPLSVALLVFPRQYIL